MTYSKLVEEHKLPWERLVVVKGPVDGNAFGVIGAVANQLRKEGYKKEAADFKEQAMSAESYDDLLAIAMSYADFEL
jgi:hypothetical protein